MKRTITAILASVLLVQLFAACSAEPEVQTGEAVTSTNTETETVTTDPLADSLPEKSYNGETFTALIRPEYSYEFYFEEETGDHLEDAVYRRNKTIEERFNVSIVYQQKAAQTGAISSEYNLALKGAILAGDAVYDLALGYQAYVAPLAMEGLFFNIYDVPYIELDKPWWNSGCVDALTVDNCLYMLTGDIGLSVWNCMYALYFNKNLISSYKLEDPYSLVKGGKWTLDKFTELVKSVSEDLNGDGVFGAEDKYGYVTSGSNHLRQYLVSLQLPVAKADKTGYPVMTLNTERTVKAVEKIYAMFWDNSVYRGAKVASPLLTEEPVVFTSDRGLFMSSFLSAASILRAMETDFGIIPQPKYDENQDNYYVATANSCTTVLIPITVKNIERSGIITEALAAEGHRSVLPVYYEIALKSKSARDAESEEMLDLMFGQIAFDFGWVHSVSMESVGAVLQKVIQDNKSADFTSFYASNEAKYTVGLQNVVEQYKKIGGK